jgi:hypothetical protein
MLDQECYGAHGAITGHSFGPPLVRSPRRIEHLLPLLPALGQARPTSNLSQVGSGTQLLNVERRRLRLFLYRLKRAKTAWKLFILNNIS